MKKKKKPKFECNNCYTKEGQHWHTVLQEGSPITLCEDCFMGRPIRREALTDWQRMKLGFYRNENKWIENIQNRGFVYENGKKVAVMTDGRGNVTGRMPEPN